MLTVVFEVDAPTLPPSVKETIAMDFERYGNVRIAKVERVEPKQMKLEG